MRLLERHVHHITDVGAYWERERKFKEIEDRLGGFPPKRYYSVVAANEPSGSMVLERDWESFAAMEAAYERLWGEPEVEALANSGPANGNPERTEYYLAVEAQ